jgi:hypothetical protein
MRSLISTSLAFVLIVGIIPMPAKAAPVSTPLGVVLQADRAMVGRSKAINGATVFQRDRQATEAEGQLRVRFGASQAHLFPGSSAVVSQSAAGFDAELTRGTVSVSSVKGETFSLAANGAVVRPGAAQATVAEVTRVSRTELLLSSRKGALEVTFNGEVTTLAEGSNYRMLLDTEAEAAQGPQGTRPAGRTRRRAIFMALGAAAAVTGIAILATQGSASPVSPSVP